MKDIAVKELINRQTTPSKPWHGGHLEVAQMMGGKHERD